jgi:hypothetical protein
MVEAASYKRKRVPLHNYSTSPCGLGRNNLSEQDFSDRNSVQPGKLNNSERPTLFLIE